ncbi:alpha/beta hydrolase fold protein [Flammeovirgaceae bacterium 311]|nr:alpha/beta hydrolase fold protein [Flammeovirgaceae bacterium 311]
MQPMKIPVGYHKLHKNKFLNYQLNRWYSLGYARKEDIESIGAKIKTFDDYISAFLEASELAVKENRLKNAATYLRAAEFLISPDNERKVPVYNEFINLFDKAFSDEIFERHKVPYNNGFLSAIKIPSKTGICKGTIIGIPGFDAFIEEFYCIWNYFTYQGYDVIAFEGPGQGASRRTYGQTFDHDYEKPAKAILDHFELSEATALGVSMGGYWIMRAAAFEKRIKRVIAMPPLYDWLEMTSPMNRKLAKWFLTKRNLTNFFVRLKMNVGTLKHTINNAIFIQNKHEPYDAVKWMMEMNKEHLNSRLIDQDVLLFTGENDAFQPPILLKKQEEALKNAKSVTTRIFLKSEQADQHCQFGNLPLVLEYMLNWINKKIYKTP